MKYEDIQKVNEGLKTTDIKGKQYVEVNQRIKAFRQLYPEGFITTEMISNTDGVCIFKAVVGDNTENGEVTLGTGTAYEKEQSSYINKTSYIENCETSAVGRALGMLGIGVDTSVASAEEVQNAIAQQEKGADEAKAKIKAQAEADIPVSKEEEDKLIQLIKDFKGKDSYEDRIKKVCKKYGVDELADLKKTQYAKLVADLSK